jgi:hypothetical protein
MQLLEKTVRDGARTIKSPTKNGAIEAPLRHSDAFTPELGVVLLFHL